MVDAADFLEALNSPSGNRLQALNLAGKHSIRINDRWRIVFRWTYAGPEDVEIIEPLKSQGAENQVARHDQKTLVQATGELADGPDVTGYKARDEIMPGLRTVHVARHGRRGSPFLMYRVAPKTTIEIIRILHDRMDLQRHLPFAPDKNAE
jgi:toxin ParE1/3/4